MAMRLFLELASRLINHRNATEFMEVPETDDGVLLPISVYQETAKFHIGMLTISLLVGLAYAGYVGYSYWMEKDPLVEYVRNLMIALVCRTFFSILFDGVILLGSTSNVGGGNALLAFEQISRALFLAFWLTFTIYLHARVQRDFNSEPTLRVYQYGIPGFAVYLSFVWIFVLQDQSPNVSWWLVESVQTFSKWIVDGGYLLFLLIQLGLVSDIGRMMMTKKQSLDNDSVSLLTRIGIMMGALVLIFWLQLGFYLGRMPLRNAKSYIYFDYFIDGLEGTLISICLFFFVKWVSTFIKLKPRGLSGTEDSIRTEVQVEERLPGGRGIVTIDSIFTTRQSGKFNTTPEEGKNDVVYSNVIEPDRLRKTLHLYNRFDIIPKKTVTVVEGEEFYDCQMPSSLEYEAETEKHFIPIRREALKIDKKILNEENRKLKSQKSLEQTQKRNAFYSSKYLILDAKEEDIPKYLETRPSISSTTETPKEEQILSDIPVCEMNEMVNKWLTGNSEDMGKPNKIQPGFRGSIEDERKDSKFKTERPPQEDKKIVSRDSQVPMDQENEKKPVLVPPDIVIEADVEATKEEVDSPNENEKIFITTIASKLGEKIRLSTSGPTSKELAPPEEHPTQVVPDQPPQHTTEPAESQSFTTTASEPDQQTRDSFVSSSSEFSIERSTSGRFFSLDDYYSGVATARSNITSRQNPIRFNHSTTISSALQ